MFFKLSLTQNTSNKTLFPTVCFAKFIPWPFPNIQVENIISMWQTPAQEIKKFNSSIRAYNLSQRMVKCSCTVNEAAFSKTGSLWLTNDPHMQNTPFSLFFFSTCSTSGPKCCAFREWGKKMMLETMLRIRQPLVWQWVFYPKNK